MQDSKDIKSLCGQVRQTAYDIHVYLKASRLEHGLLINFGSYKFELRKFAWNHSFTGRSGGFLLSLFSVFFGFLW